MRPYARFRFFALSAAIAAAGAACCSPSVSPDRPTAGSAAELDKGPLEAYAALREEVMKGNFIALFDCATSEYRAASFPAEKYRSMVASDPRIMSMGLTAQDVARMTAREAVDAYFKLLPMNVQAGLAAALSDSKVIGKSDLPGGRASIEIESGKVKSRILFRKEDGEWRMDGEEKGVAPEDR